MKSSTRLLGIISACLTVCLVSSAATTDVPVKNPEWSVKPGNLSPGQPNPYINSVAINGDGTAIVGGTFYHSYGASATLSEKGNAPAAGTQTDTQSGTFGIYCYDQNKKQLWQDEFNSWQGVYWVDISVNGKYAAAGGWFSGAPNYAGFVRVYDAKTGTRLIHQPTAKRVNQVQFSEDGAWLMSVAESLIVYNIKDSTCTVTDTYALSDPTDYIVTGGMSDDGRTIICATYNGQILGFKNSDGKLLLIGQFAYPTGTSCHMLQVSATGMAFVAGGPSGQIYYFRTPDLRLGKPPTVTFQTGSTGSVYGVAIADDGASFVGLVNNGKAGIVYYVDKTGTQKWSAPLLHNPNCASLNYRKNMLAIADGHPDNTPGTFYLFDPKTGAERWYCTVGNMSWPIAISKDGKAIAAGSDDSNIYFFRP